MQVRCGTLLGRTFQSSPVERGPPRPYPDHPWSSPQFSLQQRTTLNKRSLSHGAHLVTGVLGKANHKCAIWSLLGLGGKAPDSGSSERSESRRKQAAVDTFFRQGF